MIDVWSSDIRAAIFEGKTDSSWVLLSMPTVLDYVTLREMAKEKGKERENDVR